MNKIFQKIQYLVLVYFYLGVSAAAGCIVGTFITIPCQFMVSYNCQARVLVLVHGPNAPTTHNFSTSVKRSKDINIIATP